VLSVEVRMKPLSPRSFKFVPGRYYGTPKELWGFRSARGGASPVSTAHDFLAANAQLLGINVETLTRSKPRVVYGLGATHVIWQQRWKGLGIHRAYVTVHVSNRDRRVYLVKSRVAPLEVLEKAPAARLNEQEAVRRAMKQVSRRGNAHVVGKPKLVWFPAKTLLHPAWKVRIHRTHRRAEFIVYVNAKTGTTIEYYDNLAQARGRAKVFLPSPMAVDPKFEPVFTKGKVQDPTPESYAAVRLLGLRPSGYLTGDRASTHLTRGRRLRSRKLDFMLETNKNRGFEEVSAYFHVDQAVRYVESLGYTGKRRIFTKPIAINARGTTDDNSWYSPGRRSLTFGTGDIDDAEDGETVLHELGHALQDAICPDFGQSLEAAAMGEGFGDYFAGSYFEELKRPRYKKTVMAWDGISVDGDPPCTRRLDSPKTYESFDHEHDDAEHENGEIWSAVLWEVRERLGRERADKVIIDSHFQLDGFTSFAKGARAILDSNFNLRGDEQQALVRIFHRRGIGPVE
jgi:hypothetical protein